MLNQFEPRPWMKTVLRLAGAYNALWGLAVVLFPSVMLRWAGFDAPIDYPQIWQCVGMVVGVYGIGYWIAGSAPYRHWPIVLVGLLGKILGPIGYVANVRSGALSGSMVWTILMNDLIWWIPFAMILWGAIRYHAALKSVHFAELVVDDPVHELASTAGKCLDDLSRERPQLVVFLRHSGCTFCRESLGDLREHRAAIESTGVGIILVHVGDESQTADIIARYGLDDLPRISDPSCRLYRQFGLELGGFRQLFGLKVWFRGIKASLIDRHGFGLVQGNLMQMPGAFVVHGGQFVRGFQHASASERPDYLGLVQGIDRAEAGPAGV